MERKRRVSADLPPDEGGEDNDVVGPMPAQEQNKPEAKKRKGNKNVWREI